MGANSSHEAMSTAHVLYGEAPNQDAHSLVYFVSPVHNLELPSSPLQTVMHLAIRHRRHRLNLGEYWACLVVEILLLRDFTRHGIMLLDVFVFEQGFRLQATNLNTYEYFTR